MRLDMLDKEILLNIFEYLDGVHLFRAFYGLNSQFDTLLIADVNTHIFNFQSIFKRDFDLICQQYIPLIFDRISAIQLSNNHETVNQINMFLSNKYSLEQFINLKALIFHNISSEKLLTKIICQCVHLPNLTTLGFLSCYFDTCRKSHTDFINQVWTLPKLNHCILDIHFNSNEQNFLPTISSKSITKISMSHLYRTVNQFNELFERTPNICLLKARLKSFDDSNQQLHSPIEFITTLNLFVIGSSSGLLNMLEKMPNLNRLGIKTLNIIIDGHQWQNVIVNHLSKLKSFEFHMNYQLHDYDDKRRLVNNLLNTYFNSYWLVDRQCFVRCQWVPDDPRHFISLYSLPDFTRSFIIQPLSFTTRTRSTCSSEDDYYRKQDNDQDINILSLFSFTFKYICFSKIETLHLELPFTGSLLFVLPQFVRLTKLIVRCYPLTDAYTATYQLRNLIDHAPQLNAFSLEVWDPVDKGELPLNLTTRSIPYFNLRDLRCSPNEKEHWFNKERCATLIRSSLAMQCEVLYVKVEKRTSIIELVKRLPNLRVLNVTSLDDKWKKTSSNDDELIKWLQNRLSCIVNRDTTSTNILLWIR